MQAMVLLLIGYLIARHSAAAGPDDLKISKLGRMAEIRHLALFTSLSSNAPCCGLSRVPFFRILGCPNSEILLQFSVLRLDRCTPFLSRRQPRTDDPCPQQQCYRGSLPRLSTDLPPC